MKLRRIFALFIFAFALPANAQQYPTRPVRLLVGYAAGSSTDIVGRVMADRLGAYWKQTVIVENRGGAAGNVAADAAAKSPGDGYTLLFAQNGLAISAAAVPNLPYSAERDLVPIAPVAATPHILIVGPDFPAKNVQELIARAKAEPGRLTFASSGVGNSDHLCGELFNLMAGIQAIHVPYKGGAPAVQDLMGGHVPMMIGSVLVLTPAIKAGKADRRQVSVGVRTAGWAEIQSGVEAGDSVVVGGAERLFPTAPVMARLVERRRGAPTGQESTAATSRPAGGGTQPAAKDSAKH